MENEFTSERIVSGTGNKSDKDLDNALRPARLDDFIGQNLIKTNMQVYISAALKRTEQLDHVLFSGPPGLGKTTLAKIIASEMGVNIIETSGPTLEKPGDLAGILTSLKAGDLLFIDEIHRIPIVVEEYLYSAMEDFFIDIVIDSGPGSRSVKLPLPKFTLAGATTREGNLSTPFRERFGIREKFKYYDVEELRIIILRTARVLGVAIEADAAFELAKRCRGTPRVANRFLRRIRDLAEVKSDGRVTLSVAMQGLQMLGVDHKGLEDLDRRILEVLVKAKKPVGLKTLAISVNEVESTIEDIYEPYLIQEGYIEKSDRGRIATYKAFDHVKIKDDDELFG